MRKLILSWLLAAVAIGGCVTYQNRSSTVPVYSDLELICQLVEDEYDESCGDLEPPQVILSEIVAALGAWGIYVHGEGYVFVDPFAPDVWEVTVHETIHYVLWELDLERETCPSERKAREWSEIITGVPINPEWEKNYGCKGK